MLLNLALCAKFGFVKCAIYIKCLMFDFFMLIFREQGDNKNKYYKHYCVLPLFHKRHLLSESEFEFSFSRSTVFVLWRYV